MTDVLDDDAFSAYLATLPVGVYLCEDCSGFLPDAHTNEVDPPGYYDDLPEGLIADESECAAGEHCCGAVEASWRPQGWRAAPVGIYLHGDRDEPRWASTWQKIA